MKSLSEGKISQIGSDEYLLPKEYRFSSKTGWIRKYSDSDEIRFYIQLGLQDSKLIYISGNELPKEQYLEKFIVVQKLNSHWYWVRSE